MSSSCHIKLENRNNRLNLSRKNPLRRPRAEDWCAYAPHRNTIPWIWNRFEGPSVVVARPGITEKVKQIHLDSTRSSKPPNRKLLPIATNGINLVECQNWFVYKPLLLRFARPKSGGVNDTAPKDGKAIRQWVAKRDISKSLAHCRCEYASTCDETQEPWDCLSFSGTIGSLGILDLAYCKVLVVQKGGGVILRGCQDHDYDHFRQNPTLIVLYKIFCVNLPSFR